MEMCSYITWYAEVELTPWVVRSWMCQGKKKASAHLCISFFTLPLSVSFSLTLFTQYLPSLMSAHCTQGPRVSVQFLFWHPFLITHVNDWSPGLGRGEQRWKSLLHDGCVQVQDSFCCRVRGKRIPRWPGNWEIKFWAPAIWTKDSPY